VRRVRIIRRSDIYGVRYLTFRDGKSGRWLTTLCYSTFRRVTGFSLGPGESAVVRIAVKRAR
jgi:hypothetical protein